MLKAFVNSFKIPDLRKKILFTIGIIAVFRLGSHIPVPNVDPNRLAELRSATTGQQLSALQFIDLFSGGALTRFAVFSLGIMPYITSSIIMQLLTVVIPKLEQWQKQGEIGIKKITQWTRYMTVTLALLQSTGLVFLFHNQFHVIRSFTAPRVALLVFTLKVNHAGVIPIIFASSVLYFPTLLQNVIHVQWFQNFVNNTLLRQTNPVYMLIYGTLVVFFAYFYTAITFNPVDTADNIRKYGGFIPGIRPGRSTSEYLSNILNRITLPGSLFLAAIALIPSIFLAVWAITAFPFGGTSILITVVVAL